MRRTQVAIIGGGPAGLLPRRSAAWGPAWRVGCVAVVCHPDALALRLSRGDSPADSAWTRLRWGRRLSFSELFGSAQTSEDSTSQRDFRRDLVCELGPRGTGQLHYQ